MEGIQFSTIVEANGINKKVELVSTSKTSYFKRCGIDN